MTKLARTIPKLTLLVVLLAATSAPTYASIAYSSCTNGCTSSNGTYGIWQAASASAGLTFFLSPNTFAPGNLTSQPPIDPSPTRSKGPLPISIMRALPARTSTRCASWRASSISASGSHAWVKSIWPGWIAKSRRARSRYW